MISFTNTPELQSQLQQCQQQKLQLEQEMQSKPRTPRGTVDFDLYRMKKVKGSCKIVSAKSTACCILILLRDAGRKLTTITFGQKVF